MIEKDEPLASLTHQNNDYRKKPLVIQAIQFSRSEWDAGIQAPFGVVCFGWPKAEGDLSAHHLDNQCWLQTLEGPLIVSDGDWIIRGVKGEFYSCKPDIFAATYEKA